MKRAICGVTALLLAFALTACAQADTASQMSLNKAELSGEEQTLLDLIGTEHVPYLLDYTVDDTVQSLQINTYELHGSEWRMMAGGGGQQLKDATGRIALTFDNIGFGIRTGVEGNGSNSYTTESDFSFEGLGTTTSYLSNETAIAYEEEIPLVIQIHTAKNEISSYFPEIGFLEPERYAELDYEKVYAVTCRFSQKTVHELTEG